MRSNQIVLILVLAVVAVVVFQIPKLQQRNQTRRYTTAALCTIRSYNISRLDPS